MIIDCPYCDSRVDAVVLQSHKDAPEGEPPFLVSLLKCPSCDQALIAGQNEDFLEDAWDKPTRLWPRSDRATWSLPSIVRVSLDEAGKCMQGGAFTACAVMCGRALEGVCVDQKTTRKTLASGLKELLDKKVIDERLYAWGEALRQMRNLGAHASDEKVSREDANDLLDFVYAICEYVYTLNAKFQDFVARQKKKGSLPKSIDAELDDL